MAISRANTHSSGARTAAGNAELINSTMLRWSANITKQSDPGCRPSGLHAAEDSVSWSCSGGAQTKQPIMETGWWLNNRAETRLTPDITHYDGPGHSCHLNAKSDLLTLGLRTQNFQQSSLERQLDRIKVDLFPVNRCAFEFAHREATALAKLDRCRQHLCREILAQWAKRFKARVVGLYDQYTVKCSWIIWNSAFDVL